MVASFVVWSGWPRFCGRVVENGGKGDTVHVRRMGFLRGMIYRE